MNNVVMIIGRLVDNPVINEEDENKETIITLASTRSYKNEDGIYDTDFVDVVLWNGIANNICEYCHKGDLVGIKGRLESKIKEDNTKELLVIAEKVTILNNKKEDE